jgi:DNA-binding NtrC family response regulator
MGDYCNHDSLRLDLMSEKILFVDDEPAVLRGYQRLLHNEFKVTAAVGGAGALIILRTQGPFAVVVSDMRMPEMTGAQFLAKVRLLWPDTVRLILSGQSDLESTIAAVNDGHIFRFLSKPCSSDQIWAAVEAALQQYRLTTAEKVLLKQTLAVVVKMLVEILGMVSPARTAGRPACGAMWKQ